MGFSSSGGAKVGTIELYGGSVAPNGWLLCNGGSVSRTLYADLFAVIGTTYGSGDGSTTFALPNYSSARFVTSSTVGIKGNGKALGLTDGTNTHSMTTRGYSSAEGYLSMGNYTSSNLPLTITSIGDSLPVKNNTGYGIVTDSSKSGITGTANIASSCRFIIKY